MNKYSFTFKNSDEKISSCSAPSKTMAAKFFSDIKKLDFKSFLKIFSIVKH